MFESLPSIPSISLTDIKSALTDVTQTANNFATLAVKKGTEARQDINKRYESQVNDFRGQVVSLFDKAEHTVTELEERFEPVMTMLTKRLPAPAVKVAATLTKQSIALRHKAHDALVGAFTTPVVTPKAVVESPVAKSPAATKAKTAPRARKTAGTKVTSAVASKTSATKTSAKAKATKATPAK